MAVRAYGQLFVQPLTPAEPPVVVGSVWSDTTTGLLKVCTSVSPYTFVTVHGGAVAWSDITDFTGSSLAQLQTRSASDLTSGTLAVARGGTNSGTALSGNSIMQSNGTAIVQGGLLTNAGGTLLTFPGISTPSTPAAGFGSLFGSTSNGHTFLDYIDQDGSVTRINRDNVLLVRNTSGGSLNKGTAVNINSSTGSVPTVRKADATDITKHAEGLMFETVANNGFGLMIFTGLLSGIDTSAFVEGDILYISATTPGALTATAPSFPTAAFKEAIAVVTNSHASAGSVEVFIGRITQRVDVSTDVTGDLPFANLAQGSALSVLGVTGNATADVASIAAGSDHQVLRRSGTALTFGSVNLAQSAAVTGTLPAGNGGTGFASFAVGDLLYADTTSTWAKLAAVASGSVLTSAGTNTAPAWSASPTLTTSLTTPKILGGTGTTSVLALQGTSGNAASGAAITFLGGNNGATEYGHWNMDNGRLMIGTTASGTGTGTQPLTAIHLGGGTPQMTADYFSGDIVPFAFRGRKARGSQSSPTKTLSGDNLVQFIGAGWEENTPGWTANAIGVMGIQANQDFTSSNQGTRFIVNLTPNNSTSPNRQLTISTAAFTVGSCITPASTGTRYLIIDTNGNITSSASAPSGT